MIYFQVYHNGIFTFRGKEVLDGLSWTNELRYVPSTTLTLPIEYRDKLTGHDEVKIFVNNKVFWGIVKRTREDKESEILEVDLDHVISEWEYRQISVNNAIKDQNINVVFKGSSSESDGVTTVTASEFTIFEDENLTAQQYIVRAGASAWSADGNTLQVNVDASAVEKKAGEYDVIFSAGGVSVTVTCTVEEEQEASEGEYYIFSASNMNLTVDDVHYMKNSDYIEKAKAQITTTEKGAGMPIPEIEVDHSSVRARDGTYTVRFSAKYIDPETGEERDMSISVTATVEGDNFADPTIADNIADIFADKNFAYPGWHLNFEHGAGDRTIDYVYSRQDKLEALTKTVLLTKDLHWRVRFVDKKVVDISPFGDIKNYSLSTKPSNEQNIRLISDPVITHEYDEVKNVCTVYSEKSDTGMSSLTLREVYNNPDLQDEMFPVVILRANVNNERDYRKYSEQFPKLAPNNELEYAILDLESIALEGGTLIEGTIAFTDISPFAPEVDEETEEISDEDRIKAAQVAYHAAIKDLKESRRYYSITFTTEELPPDINPGDKVRLIYDNNLYILGDCSNYLKKILSYDDYFVITRIDYDIDVSGAEIDQVTLEPYVRIAREQDETSWTLRTAIV